MWIVAAPHPSPWSGGYVQIPTNLEYWHISPVLSQILNLLIPLHPLRLPIHVRGSPLPFLA